MEDYFEAIEKVAGRAQREHQRRLPMVKDRCLDHFVPLAPLRIKESIVALNTEVLAEFGRFGSNLCEEIVRVSRVRSVALNEAVIRRVVLLGDEYLGPRAHISLFSTFQSDIERKLQRYGMSVEWGDHAIELERSKYD